MAIVGINRVNVQRKKDALDRILEGVAIASRLTGTALDVGRFNRQGDQIEKVDAQRELSNDLAQKAEERAQSKDERDFVSSFTPVDVKPGISGADLDEQGNVTRRVDIPDQVPKGSVNLRDPRTGERGFFQSIGSEDQLRTLRIQKLLNDVRPLTEEEAQELSRVSRADPALFRGKSTSDPFVRSALQGALRFQGIANQTTSIGLTEDERTQKLVSGFTKSFNADKVIGKLDLMIDAAQNLEAITAEAANANPVAGAALPTFTARAAGEVGNLSEGDKRPFGGSQSILDRLSRIGKKAVNGNVLDDDIAYIKRLAVVMGRNAQNRRNARGLILARQFAKGTPKFNELQAREIIGVTAKDSVGNEVDVDAEEAVDKLFGGN